MRIGVLGPSSLMARPLGRETFLLCAAPEYLARAPAPRRPEELATHRFVDLRTETRPRGAAGGATERARRAPVALVLRSNEPGIMVQAALAGASVVLASRAMATGLLARGLLVPCCPPGSRRAR